MSIQQTMEMRQEPLESLWVFYDKTHKRYYWDLCGAGIDRLYEGLQASYGRDRRSAEVLTLSPASMLVAEIPERFIPDTSSEQWENNGWWCTSAEEKRAAEKLKRGT